MIFILFAYDVILQDLVPKEEKNEISIHAHFTSCENEFHMNFQWVFLSREAQQYGADNVCILITYFVNIYENRYLPAILYFCFKVVAATDTFLTVLNRYKEIRI